MIEEKLKEFEKFEKKDGKSYTCMKCNFEHRPGDGCLISRDEVGSCVCGASDAKKHNLGCDNFVKKNTKEIFPK